MRQKTSALLENQADSIREHILCNRCHYYMLENIRALLENQADSIREHIQYYSIGATIMRQKNIRTIRKPGGLYQRTYIMQQAPLLCTRKTFALLENQADSIREHILCNRRHYYMLENIRTLLENQADSIREHILCNRRFCYALEKHPYCQKNQAKSIREHILCNRRLYYTLERYTYFRGSPSDTYIKLFRLSELILFWQALYSNSVSCLHNGNWFQRDIPISLLVDRFPNSLIYICVNMPSYRVKVTVLYRLGQARVEKYYSFHKYELNL